MSQQNISVLVTYSVLVYYLRLLSSETQKKIDDPTLGHVNSPSATLWVLLEACLHFREIEKPTCVFASTISVLLHQNNFLIFFFLLTYLF